MTHEVALYYTGPIRAIKQAILRSRYNAAAMANREMTTLNLKLL
jgi:hypothetical protein